MAPRKTEDPTEQPSTPVRDPKDWVTGEDPMTPAQVAYLKRLSEQAGEPFDSRLDQLRQAVIGRGKSPVRRRDRPSE